ncbi:MAG: hypothetical protein K6U89_04850 [Chloroflexi bacterium]|nr:hypothetical protein [Chloroflexota bacterium]
MLAELVPPQQTALVGWVLGLCCGLVASVFLVRAQQRYLRQYVAIWRDWPQRRLVERVTLGRISFLHVPRKHVAEVYFRRQPVAELEELRDQYLECYLATWLAFLVPFVLGLLVQAYRLDGVFG